MFRSWQPSSHNKYFVDIDNHTFWLLSRKRTENRVGVISSPNNNQTVRIVWNIQLKDTPILEVVLTLEIHGR